MHDSNASVVLGGDMNEFTQTRSVFGSLSKTLYDINEISDVDSVERYTYVYEQHTQEIDHIFVSDAIARRGTEVEHVHVNTWASSTTERASDHDPTVAKMRICDSSQAQGVFVLSSFCYFTIDTSSLSAIRISTRFTFPSDPIHKLAEYVNECSTAQMWLDPNGPPGHPQLSTSTSTTDTCNRLCITKIIRERSQRR